MGVTTVVVQYQLWQTVHRALRYDMNANGVFQHTVLFRNTPKRDLSLSKSESKILHLIHQTAKILHMRPKWVVHGGARPKSG